jgi:hypothetical protein
MNGLRRMDGWMDGWMWCAVPCHGQHSAHERPPSRLSAQPLQFSLHCCASTAIAPHVLAWDAVWAFLLIMHVSFATLCVSAGLGQWSEAVGYYTKATQLAPSFSFAAANRSLALYQTGNTEQAIRCVSDRDRTMLVVSPSAKPSLYTTAVRS